MVKKIIGIIPARSGSKRIKNKNLTKIKSTPLINFISSAINRSNLIQNFYVATDKKSYLMLLRIKKSSYFINVQNKVQQMSLRQRK